MSDCILLQVKSDVDPRWFLKYTDVMVGEPEIQDEAHQKSLATPFEVTIICGL